MPSCSQFVVHLKVGNPVTIITVIVHACMHTGYRSDKTSSINNESSTHHSFYS